VQQLTRWTVCLVRNHKWAKRHYPGDGDEPGGFFLRCLRCDYEKHDIGTSVKPPIL
jgi:leucyl aminopeptidase (aminopeptidase T)